MTPTTHIIITTTCNTEVCRDALVQGLVEGKLAACVQVSDIQSHYHWKGKVAHDREFLLTIKTRDALKDKVEAFIKATHSYECPQIVVYPMLAASAEYLTWMDEVTQ